jgi:heme A synthase
MGFAAVLLTILLLQALALRIVLRRGGGGVRKSVLHPLAALALGLLGGALVSGLAAALLGRYPTFLGFSLPAVF